MRVCIIIPVYNEGSVILKTIKSIQNELQQIEHLIVVVDDGSADNTDTQARKAKGVIVINHLMNMGAGAATRTGLRYAKNNSFDFVVTADADGQHLPMDIKKVLKSCMNKDADMVIGSRLINIAKGMPWYRRLGNKGLNYVTALIFGINVTDSQSGLKAINKKAINLLTFDSNRFAFSSEMIWRAKRCNLRISEVPIQAVYTQYSLTKGQSNWGAIDIIRQLIKRRLIRLING
ncbi:MAG: glycosyltransferase family 2 protein [Bacteroidetes bacterium]|nr:glycosyltransferase family 2 protein [Bacteroidota bacterium]MCB9817849.1 glycosyltransferase family 2 protein [Candidatus Nomurabacteria bacterium]